MTDQPPLTATNSHNTALQSIQINKFQSPDYAIGAMCRIAMFDAVQARRQFSSVMNEVFAASMHGQYAVASMVVDDGSAEPKLSPAGYIIWASMNKFNSTVYGNGTRELSPSDYYSGEDKWLIQFVTPFGFRTELWDYFKQQVTALSKSLPLLMLHDPSDLLYNKENNITDTR